MNNSSQQQQPLLLLHIIVRWGCVLLCVIVTIYSVVSLIVMIVHATTSTFTFTTSTRSTIISQQQQQLTSPLYLTSSEQDLISRVLGIDKSSSSSSLSSISTRKSKQCTSTIQTIQIPPSTLRKGKSQSMTEVEYQNQAIQLVHNIRVLLGTATQLASRQQQQQQSAVLPDKNNNNNVTTNSTESLPFDLPTQQQQQQPFYKSFDNAVIMDYGCGPGRLLIGLLSANICFTKYIGVDVNMKDIQWLTESYSAFDSSNNIGDDNEKQKFVLTGTQKLLHRKRTNDKNQYNINNNHQINGLYQMNDEQQRYEFIRVNVKNERYNKNGQALDTDSITKNERIVFPSLEMQEQYTNTVDVLIVRSVFSHMLSADIYHHLRALYPLVQSPNGLLMVSLFVNTVPQSPVETVISHETQPRGNHLVYISKQVFETMIYETGYSIVLYLSQWNMGEDVYVLSTNGSKRPVSLFHDLDDLQRDEEVEEKEVSKDESSTNSQ